MRIIHRTFDTLGCSTILIGRVGENHVTRLDVDVSGELVKYPQSVFEIMLKTPAFDEPYPLLVTLDGNSLYYDFSSSDLQSSGFGELEVLLCSPDGSILKSATTRVRIDSSIITGRYPGPIEKILAELRAMIEEVKNAGIKTVTVLPDDPNDNEIVYLNAEDSGFYRWDGSDWVRLTDDGEGLEALANIVSDIDNRVGKIAVVEKYSELIEHEDALAAFVYGLDGGQKSFADYDPETDAEIPLYIADSVAYDPSATISGDIIIFDGTETEVVLGVIPVYEPNTVDPVYSAFEMFLETSKSNPKAYMSFLTIGDPTTEEMQKIIDAFEVVVPEGAEVSCIFVHAFENIDGVLISDGSPVSDTLSFVEGWNVLFVVETEEMAFYVYPVQDVNEFFNLGIYESIQEYPSGMSFLLETIVLTGETDKRGVYVKTNGEWIDPYRPDDADDVTMLGFETYSDFVVRDEAITGESIQDVPVYVQGGQGTICSLYEHTDEPVGLDYDNGIELIDLRQMDTGMPLFVVSVTVDGVRYSYYPKDYNAGLAGMVYAGWNVNNQPSDPPTITSFTPDRFRFGSIIYPDLNDLPDTAKSALRSLSRCINVSAFAMGTIRVPDDAVTRFAGTFEPSRKYAFSSTNDCTFPLPSVPFAEMDEQFVLYLICEVDIDLVFSSMVKFAGGALPNSDAGSHKIFGCWLKDVGAWAIGGIDYSEVS